MPYALADICCCAGLAADGYMVTGAQVEGFDIRAQPDYPYPFHLGDGIAYLQTNDAERFDALHTSWPCQLFTTAKHLRTAQGCKSKETVDLLTPGLALLRGRWGHKPWVAENVDDNTKQVRRIMEPRAGEYLTMLCGSMVWFSCAASQAVPDELPCSAHGLPSQPFPSRPTHRQATSLGALPRARGLHPLWRAHSTERRAWQAGHGVMALTALGQPEGRDTACL